MTKIEKTKEVNKVRDEVEEAKIKLGINSEENNNEKKYDEEEEEEVAKNVVVLSTEINGETEIVFNLDSITGRVITDVKDDYVKKRKSKKGLLPELDDHYYILMSEKMTGIRAHWFLDLPAKDYNKVLNFVKDFLQED